MTERTILYIGAGLCALALLFIPLFNNPQSTHADVSNDQPPLFMSTGTIGTLCPTCVKWDVINNMSPFTLNLNTTGTPIINATGNSANSDFNLNGFGNTGGASGTDFQITSARGTYKSPTAIQSGDTVSRMTFAGWDGSSYNLPAGQTSLNSLATENFSPTHHGTEIRIANTLTGSATKTTSFRIFGNQSIGFGSTGVNPNTRVILNQYENASSLLPIQHSYYFPDGNGLLDTVVTSNITKGLTANAVNQINYTPTANSGIYRVSGYVYITAHTGTNNLNIQIMYKDYSGNSVTTTNVDPNSWGSSNGVHFMASQVFIIDNSATPIKVSTTGTIGGTITYNLVVVLERLN